MIFLRKKTTTTESFDQILALGAENQEEAEEKVDEAGALFAFPASAAGPEAVDSSAFLDLPPEPVRRRVLHPRRADTRRRRGRRADWSGV